MEKSRLPVFFTGSSKRRGSRGSKSPHPTGHVSHKGGGDQKLGDTGPPPPRSLPRSPPPLSPPPSTSPPPVSPPHGSCSSSSQSSEPVHMVQARTNHSLLKDDDSGVCTKDVALAAQHAVCQLDGYYDNEEEEDDSVFIQEGMDFSPGGKSPPRSRTGKAGHHSSQRSASAGQQAFRKSGDATSGRSISAGGHRRTPPPVPPRSATTTTVSGKPRSRSPSNASSSSGASHSRVTPHSGTTNEPPGHDQVSSGILTPSSHHHHPTSVYTTSVAAAADTQSSSSSSVGKPAKCSSGSSSKSAYRYNVARKRGLQREAEAASFVVLHQQQHQQQQHSRNSREPATTRLDNYCARDISGEAVYEGSKAEPSPVRIGTPHPQVTPPALLRNFSPSPRAREARTRAHQAAIRHHGQLGTSAVDCNNSSSGSSYSTGNSNSNILPRDKRYRVLSDSQTANWQSLDQVRGGTPGVATELVSWEKLEGADRYQLANWQDEQPGARPQQHVAAVDRARAIKHRPGKQCDQSAAHLYYGSSSSRSGSRGHGGVGSVGSGSAASTVCTAAMDSIVEGVQQQHGGAMDGDIDMESERFYDAAFQARVVFSHGHGGPWGGVHTPLRASPRWRSYSSPSCGVRMAQMRAHKRYGEDDDDSSSGQRLSTSSSMSDGDRPGSLARDSPATVSMGSRGSTPVHLDHGVTTTTCHLYMEHGPTPTTPLYIDPCVRNSFCESDEHDYEEIDEPGFGMSPPVSPRRGMSPPPCPSRGSLATKQQQRRDYEAAVRKGGGTVGDRITIARPGLGTTHSRYSMDDYSHGECMITGSSDRGQCQTGDGTVCSPVHLNSPPLPLSGRTVYPEVSPGTRDSVTSGPDVWQIAAHSKGLSRSPTRDSNSRTRKSSTDGSRSRSSSAASRRGESPPPSVDNSSVECQEKGGPEIDVAPSKWSGDRSRKVSTGSGQDGQTVSGRGGGPKAVNARQSTSVKSMAMETGSQVSGMASKIGRPKANVSHKSVGTMTPVSALKIVMSRRDAKAETASVRSQPAQRSDSRDHRGNAEHHAARLEKTPVQGSRLPSDSLSRSNKSHVINKLGRKLPQRPVLPSRVAAFHQKTCSGVLNDRGTQCFEDIKGEIDSSLPPETALKSEMCPRGHETDGSLWPGVTDASSDNTPHRDLLTSPKDRPQHRGQQSNTCERDTSDMATSPIDHYERHIRGARPSRKTSGTQRPVINSVNSDGVVLDSGSGEGFDMNDSSFTAVHDKTSDAFSSGSNNRASNITTSTSTSTCTVPQGPKVLYNSKTKGSGKPANVNNMQASQQDAAGASASSSASASKLHRPGVRKPRQLPTPRAKQGAGQKPTQHFQNLPLSGGKDNGEDPSGSTQTRGEHSRPKSAGTPVDIGASLVASDLCCSAVSSTVTELDMNTCDNGGSSNIQRVRDRVQALTHNRPASVPDLDNTTSSSGGPEHALIAKNKPQASRLASPFRLQQGKAAGLWVDTRTRDSATSVDTEESAAAATDSDRHQPCASPKSKLRPPTLAKPRKLSADRTRAFQSLDITANQEVTAMGQKGNDKQREGGSEKKDTELKSPSGTSQPRLVKPYSLSRSSPFSANFTKSRPGVGSSSPGCKPAESTSGLARLDEDHSGTWNASAVGSADCQQSAEPTNNSNSSSSVPGHKLDCVGAVADGHQNSRGTTDREFGRQSDSSGLQGPDSGTVAQQGTADARCQSTNNQSASRPTSRDTCKSERGHPTGDPPPLDPDPQCRDESASTARTDNNSNIMKGSGGAAPVCGSSAATLGSKYTVALPLQQGPGSPAPAPGKPCNKGAAQKYEAGQGHSRGQNSHTGEAKSITRTQMQSEAKTVERPGICQASAHNEGGNYSAEPGMSLPSENGDNGAATVCTTAGSVSSQVGLLAAFHTEPGLGKPRDDAEIIDTLVVPTMAPAVGYATVMECQHGDGHLPNPALLSAKCLLTNNLGLDGEGMDHAGLTTGLCSESSDIKWSIGKPNKPVHCEENTALSIMCIDDRKGGGSHFSKLAAPQKLDLMGVGKTLTTPHLGGKGRHVSSGSTSSAEGCNRDVALFSPTTSSSSHRDSWDASQETVGSDPGILGTLKMSESGYDSWRSQSSSMTTCPTDELSDPEQQRSKTWDRATGSKLERKSKMKDLCLSHRQTHPRSRGLKDCAESEESSENSSEQGELPQLSEQDLPTLALPSDGFIRSDSENTLTTILSTRGGPGNLEGEDSEMDSPHESDGESDHDQLVDSSTEDYQDMPAALQYGKGSWEAAQIFAWPSENAHSSGGGYTGATTIGVRENTSSCDKKVFKSDSDETILADEGYQLPVVQELAGDGAGGNAFRAQSPHCTTQTNHSTGPETTNQQPNSMTNPSDATQVARNDRADKSTSAHSYVETWRCQQMGLSQAIQAIPPANQIETEGGKSRLSQWANPSRTQEESDRHPQKHLARHLSRADRATDSTHAECRGRGAIVDRPGNLGGANEQDLLSGHGSSMAAVQRQPSAAGGDNSYTCQPPLPVDSTATCAQQAQQQAANCSQLPQSRSHVNTTPRAAINQSLAETKLGLPGVGYDNPNAKPSSAFRLSDEYENICDDYLEGLPPGRGSESTMGSTSPSYPSPSSSSVGADDENDVFGESSDLFVIPPTGYLLPAGPPSPQRSISSPSLQDEDFTTLASMGMPKSNSFLLSQNSLHRTKATSSLNLEGEAQGNGNGNRMKEMAVSEDSLHTLPLRGKKRSQKQQAKARQTEGEDSGGSQQPAISDAGETLAVIAQISEDNKTPDDAGEQLRTPADDDVEQQPSSSAIRESVSDSRPTYTACDLKVGALGGASGSSSAKNDNRSITETGNTSDPSPCKSDSPASEKSSSPETDTKLMVNAAKEGQKRRFGRFGMLRFRGRQTPTSKEPAAAAEDKGSVGEPSATGRPSGNKVQKGSSGSRTMAAPPMLVPLQSKTTPSPKSSDDTSKQGKSKLPSASPLPSATGRKSSLPTTTSSPKHGSKIQTPGSSRRHRSENDKPVQELQKPAGKDNKTTGLSFVRKQAMALDSNKSASSMPKLRKNSGSGSKIGSTAPPGVGRFTPTLSNVPKIEKTKTISEGSNDTTDSGLSSISSADTSPKDVRTHTGIPAAKSGLKKPAASRPTKLLLPGALRRTSPGGAGHQRKMSSDSDQRVRPHSAPRERHIVTSPATVKRDNSASPTRLAHHWRTCSATSASSRLPGAFNGSIHVANPVQGRHQVYQAASKCQLESSSGHSNEKRSTVFYQRKNWAPQAGEPAARGGRAEGGGEIRRQFQLLRGSSHRGIPRRTPTEGVGNQAASWNGNQVAAVSSPSPHPSSRETVNRSNHAGIPRSGRSLVESRRTVQNTSKGVENGSVSTGQRRDSAPLSVGQKTITGMPQGHRVGVAEMEEARKRRAAMRKGASFPESRGMDTLDVAPNPNRGPRAPRPKSAEFHMDLSRVSDLPCFTKTHSRSPSEGSKDFVGVTKSLEKKPPQEPGVVSPVGSNLFQKLFNLRKSPNRDKSPTPTKTNTRTELQAMPITRDNANHTALSPSSVLNVNDLEQEIQVRRYHSLPRRSIEEARSPTPPIAIFSSDEDISSVPSTPKHIRGSKSPIRDSSVTHRASTSSPARSRPVTPETSDTALLLMPRYKTCCVIDLEKQAQTVESTGADEHSLSKSAPVGAVAPADDVESSNVSSNKPRPRQRRYGAGPRHHSADIITYLPPPSPRTQPVYPRPRHKPDSKPTQLSYHRQRHHTIDLACIVVTPPESSHPDQVFLSPGTPPPRTPPPPPPPQWTPPPPPRTPPPPTPPPRPAPQSSTEASPPPRPPGTSSEYDRPPRPPSTSSDHTTFAHSTAPRRISHSLSVDAPSPPPTPRGVLGGQHRLPLRLERHWSISEEVLRMGSTSRYSPDETAVTPPGGGIVQQQTTTGSPTGSTCSMPASPPPRPTVTLRRQRPVSTLASPERVLRERPKSECLTVRWADSLQRASEEDLTDKRGKKSLKERPKSDLGGRRAVSEALQQHELKERFGSLVTLADIGKDSPTADKTRVRGRRMSTPHPIKIRVSQGPPQPNKNKVKVRRGRMRRSSSAPDLVEDGVKRRKKSLFQGAMFLHSILSNVSWQQVACSSKVQKLCLLPPDTCPALTAQAGDLAVAGGVDSSDDEDTPDATSLGGASETSSVSSGGRHSARFDEIFEDEGPTYADALWDHVTLDPEELGFCVGEVIEVTDISSKDWWWGTVDSRQGWFPATFVRLRVNQCETADEFALKVKEGQLDTQAALDHYSSQSMLSRDQARTNVVKEILQAEKEYVRHLKDVVEGYVERARRRPEMFSPERLTTIFGNLEAIYRMSRDFLADISKHVVHGAPHTSQLGQCFLRHKKGFEIYSVYCNNHPFALEELRLSQKNKSYQHFFEACRLLQQMIEIPLEGFLLTPVQKICKYPLQLRELLKYTRPEHPDYHALQDALESMKQIASLINERKRKMESLEKLAEWQDTIDDWQGADLIEESSELIHSGELTKVTTSGWHQDRVFFLFDHQLIYCKKDLLWRDLLVYRGCIDMDQCTLEPVQDGKDLEFNTSIKHGLKLRDSTKDKSYLLFCRSAQEKDRWLRAFAEERRRVSLDKQNGFDLTEFKQQAAGTYLQRRLQDRQRDRAAKKKQKISQMCHRQGYLQNLPPHATLPKGINPRAVYHGSGSQGRRWFFTKKNKR